jgi:hypothetical protein
VGKTTLRRERWIMGLSRKKESFAPVEEDDDERARVSASREWSGE